MLLAMKTRDVIRAIRSVYRHSLTVVNCSFFRKSRRSVREGKFFLFGEGGAGLRRGGSLVNFLQIGGGGGQTCFIINRGRVTVFFGKEKITPCRFYFVYTSKATSQD